MKQVLSIQSSVAAGFVGNTVAGPVLTALGQHPLLVDTVLLAAHPGYGKRAGGAVPDSILADVLDGILTITDTAGMHIVTSGYLGSAGQAAGIAALVDGWRGASGGTYILDPVLGDGGRLYVAQDIADAMRAELLPRADIITPNHYELSWCRTATSPDGRHRPAAGTDRPPRPEGCRPQVRLDGTRDLLVTQTLVPAGRPPGMPARLSPAAVTC